MQQALDSLLGEHSFAAFKRSGSDRLDSLVEVQVVKCYRQEAFLYLEIQANSFLYGMVRLLVGMLVEVGIGKRSSENFTEIWQHQRREEVKYSAPAKGLCLLRVGYPEFPFAQPLWFDTQPTFHLAR
jgi:tRNA pseudouridine38-40 synthase